MDDGEELLLTDVSSELFTLCCDLKSVKKAGTLLCMTSKKRKCISLLMVLLLLFG